MERELLVKMFHRSGTEQDEETDPERGSLEWNCFVGFITVLFGIIGLENHRVQKECEQKEDEKQLHEKHHQIFRVVLNPAASLRGNELIDIVEIDTAGKQQDHEQNTRNFLVMLIERIGDRLDLLLSHCLLQAGSDGHYEECDSTDPHNRR